MQSVVSISAMPAVNRSGRQQIGVPGDVLQGQERGRPEQQHLGRGIEAQAEQEPDRVELPLLADRPHPPAEEPVEEAAVVQLPLELGLVVLAAAHGTEHLDDAATG